MKQIIKAILRKAGWELSHLNGNNHSTMNGALSWLSSNGFEINTILDVGASNGRWSEDCMNFFPNAKYVLFEPQPSHSEALDTFASRNKNAIAVKKAVGSSEGYATFDASGFGGALSTNEGANTIKVGLTTIDASVTQLKTEAPYLLKLDTHGFEKSILQGADNTLQKTDILIIEAYNYKITDEAMLFWELCAFLSTKGFRAVDMVDVLHRPYDFSLWQMDLIFIRSTWQGFDYISYR